MVPICKTIDCHQNSLPGGDYCVGCIMKLSDLQSGRDDAEYTGGSVSYYSCPVDDPISGGTPYIAECGDIIEMLGMDYNEGNAFKAIWRKCAARTLNLKKKGYRDGLYDSEKVVYFGERMLVVEQRKQTQEED